MKRLKLALPNEWHYKTDIRVRVTDLNYGNHLANDKFLSLIHEARVRFLHDHGHSEIDFFSIGLIQVDTQIVYKNQAFLGDHLTFFLNFEKPTSVGFNIFYKIIRGKAEIARAKTGLAFFNYQTLKIAKPSKEGLDFLDKSILTVLPHT